MTAKLPAPFAAALRAELLDVVRNSRKRRWPRKWTIGTAVLIVALGGAGTATALGILLPGAPLVAELSDTTTFTLVGSQTIDLGATPDDANALSINFTCRTPGHYEVVDNFSVECFDDEPNSVTFTTIDLPRDGSLAVTAPPTGEWELAVAFVNTTTTPWATNASGQTYGITNEHGSPDLIAVSAEDGVSGYIRATDLADANGDTASQSFTSPEDALQWQESVRNTSVPIPVYLYDGHTQIGTFTLER